MPAGRPPKPTALHKLHGTYRDDRHGERADSEGELFTGVPDKPHDLGPDADLLWDSVVGQLKTAKVVAEIDGASLEAMCRWWGRYRELMRRVSETDFDDEVCETLELRARRAWLAFDRISSRFGMTPADRAKLKSAKPEEKENPLSEFGIVG